MRLSSLLALGATTDFTRLYVQRSKRFTLDVYSIYPTIMLAIVIQVEYTVDVFFSAA